MKGFVYKLWSTQTDNIYIGSTKQKYLCWRLAQHKKYLEQKKYCSSVEIVKYSDVKIESLEIVEFNHIQELRAKEGEWIRKSNCINKQIPGRTPQEYIETHKDEKAEYDKKYREIHKQKLAEKKKEYREIHKQKLAENRREYYETHKEQKAEYDKKYRETHKEQKAEYMRKYREQKKLSTA